ncbi:hypothetical protein Celaphus_00013704 [Cervus elaphus hippelaphus]|uniref:Uncharacterized protein n=1 Tax=Cervus elaphus hippelaphus TaxID=46360 RepID=A0A212CCD0_CEREH|nr:hypothetical protein Celaphus_00013704 [Cervus elaphus hippelaphus]
MVMMVVTVVMVVMVTMVVTVVMVTMVVMVVTMVMVMVVMVMVVVIVVMMVLVVVVMVVVMLVVVMMVMMVTMVTVVVMVMMMMVVMVVMLVVMVHILRVPLDGRAKRAWPTPAPAPKPAPPQIQGCQTVTTSDLVGSVLYRDSELGGEGRSPGPAGSSPPALPTDPHSHPRSLLQVCSHSLSSPGTPVPSCYRDFCFEKHRQQVPSLPGESDGAAPWGQTGSPSDLLTSHEGLFSVTFG